MLIVVICEKYGWDYHTYMSQPEWFLSLIHQRMLLDAKKEKHEASKAKHKK